jgi:hypothetical protein
MLGTSPVWLVKGTKMIKSKELDRLQVEYSRLYDDASSVWELEDCPRYKCYRVNELPNRKEGAWNGTLWMYVQTVGVI